MNNQAYAGETNPITPEAREAISSITRDVDWTYPGLKVTRLRLLTDIGFPVWDVSYCVGILPSGEVVGVTLPFTQLSRRKWKSEIISMAKRDKVFAKGLGILDNTSTLI